MAVEHDARRQGQIEQVIGTERETRALVLHPQGGHPRGRAVEATGASMMVAGSPRRSPTSRIRTTRTRTRSGPTAYRSATNT